MGFIIYIYNESADKSSGHFVTPLPQGVQKEECHFIPRDRTVRQIYSRTSVTRILKGRVSGDSSNRGRLVIQFVVLIIDSLLAFLVCSTVQIKLIRSFNAMMLSHYNMGK